MKYDITIRVARSSQTEKYLDAKLQDIEREDIMKRGYGNGAIAELVRAFEVYTGQEEEGGTA